MLRSAALASAPLVTPRRSRGCVLRRGRRSPTACSAARPVLTVALIAGLAGYALSYFVARRSSAAFSWFGGYGLVLLADGAIRVRRSRSRCCSSPRQTVAAVAIAAAAAGGAVAPLSLAAAARAAPPGGAGTRGRSRSAARSRFALPAAVIAGCEQVLVSGGPLLVLIAGGPGAAAAAGVLFAATLLVRAPVFLFQGVAASLLPSLTTFRARGDEASLHRATVQGRA